MSDAYLKVKDNGEQGLALEREETDKSISELGAQLDEIVTSSPKWTTVTTYHDAVESKSANASTNSQTGNPVITLASSPDYDSYRIYLEAGDTFCAPDTLPAYYAMTIGTGYAVDGQGDPAWTSTQITCDASVRYRKVTSTNTLPTENDPFVCTDRTVLVITLTKGTAPSYKIQNGSEYALTEEISNAQTQKAVLAVNDAESIYIHKKSAWFYVFVPTYDPDKYIRYAVQHYTSGNADVCEIRQVDLYNGHDLIGVNTDRYKDGVIFPIAIEGQWELAIQTATDDNFVGGKNHGHERIITDDNDLYNLWFFVDGKAVTPATNDDYVCKTFAFMSNTQLFHIENDPPESGDPSPIAIHRNKTVFALDRIEMEQALEWLVGETVKDSYICMLPMCRGNDGNSDVQVTAYGYDYLTYTPYDISTAGFDNYMHDQIPGRTKITEYGPASGIEATAEIIGDFLEGQYGYIRNNGSSGDPPVWTSAYNKLYMSYAGTNKAVVDGEKWAWKNRYNITHTD